MVIGIFKKNFGITSVIIYSLNHIVFKNTAISFISYKYRLFSVLFFNIGKFAIYNLFSIINNQNIGTQIFNMFYDMRTKKHGGVFFLQFENFIFKYLHIYRVQSRKRLIKYKKLWIIKTGDNKLHLLLH